MIYSNVSVEQIDVFGNICEDFGEILSPTEMASILHETFGCETFDKGYAYGEYQGKKYCFCYKNVSYLGIPHPIFKKRIQIPHKFVDVYNQNLEKGITTFFLGIYKYKENIIFVNFDTKKYVQNKAHNSSAHVLAIDLVQATLNGFHYKVDAYDNEIFCFGESAVKEFFSMYLLKTSSFVPKMFTVFNGFYDSLRHDWYGIDCYKDMIRDNYHRKFQPEWPGAYLEYSFENACKSNESLAKFVTYSPSRGGTGFDLDLYFPTLDEYGDLKAHSINSGAIIGNKTSTVQEAISKGKSIYYITYNHTTEADKDNGYAVTEFWNTEQDKLDRLHSYGERMKYAIQLQSYMILEINKNNYRYLNDQFQTGFMNSDGKPRSGKVTISKKEITNFKVHEYSGKTNKDY